MFLLYQRVGSLIIFHQICVDIQGYKLLRNDREGRGAGVAFYVKSLLGIKVILFGFEFQEIEFLFMEIKVGFELWQATDDIWQMSFDRSHETSHGTWYLRGDVGRWLLTGNRCYMTGGSGPLTGDR